MGNYNRTAASKTFIYTIQYLFVINMQKLAESKHETEWITLSLDEYESMKATIETLSSPEAMEMIRKSEEDIKAGRTKKLGDVKKELGI